VGMPSQYLVRHFRAQSQHHIWNRGAYKNCVFRESEDYWIFRRILRSTMRIMEETVEFKAFVLMPNHYHFQLYQEEDRAISKYMHIVGTKFGMFMKEKYDHSGRIFEGPYKSELLLTLPDQRRVHRYILENPAMAGLVDWPHAGITP
jgi:REP element-mobilizing transposase RayT